MILTITSRLPHAADNWCRLLGKQAKGSMLQGGRGGHRHLATSFASAGRATFRPPSADTGRASYRPDPEDLENELLAVIVVELL